MLFMRGLDNGQWNCDARIDPFKEIRCSERACERVGTNGTIAWLRKITEFYGAHDNVYCDLS